MEDFQGFDWDQENEEKYRKHGLTLDEIESIFESKVHVSAHYRHATSEDRYQAVGITPAGRYVFLVFCIRERNDGNFIRVISARYMHKKEVDHYEEQTKK